MRSRATVQSPAGYAAINLQRAGLRTRLQDSGYRYRIHPDETTALMVEGDLTFGFDPGDLRRYGGVGDSDGTVGDGVDNSDAIQKAVNFAMVNGNGVFVPPGVYRFETAIDFTQQGTTNKIDFGGASMLQTVFFADFVNVTPMGAFALNNTSGHRAYVHWHDFQMFGRNDAASRVSGIYANWSGFLSEFESVFIWKFWNGIVLANDYHSKFWNVHTNYNLNSGVQVGYEIDGVTLGKCNNLGWFGGGFSFNKYAGIFAHNADTLGFSQIAPEGNETIQIHLSSCRGVSFTGLYTEHAEGDPGAGTKQVYLQNCTGVTIDGHTVTAFKHTSQPMIHAEGTSGLSIRGLSVRSDGGPFNAICVRLDDSDAIIESSTLNGATVGVYLGTLSRLTLRKVTFSDYTYPVNCNGAIAHKVDWQDATAAYVAASSFDATNVVDLQYQDNTKCKIDETKVFNVTVSFAELAAGKAVITHTLPGEKWRVMDAFILNETPGNAGGDRNIQLTDSFGAVIYGTYSAATAKAATAATKLGAAGFPITANADAYTPTPIGSNLLVKSAGGTTNYTVGSFNVTVTAMRTA
jgi:hypothetical protein